MTSVFKQRLRFSFLLFLQQIGIPEKLRRFLAIFHASRIHLYLTSITSKSALSAFNAPNACFTCQIHISRFRQKLSLRKGPLQHVQTKNQQTSRALTLGVSTIQHSLSSFPRSASSHSGSSRCHKNVFQNIHIHGKLVPNFINPTFVLLISELPPDPTR